MEGIKGGRRRVAGQDQRLSWRTVQEALNASENLQKQRQWVADEDSAWSSACASACVTGLRFVLGPTGQTGSTTQSLSQTNKQTNNQQIAQVKVTSKTERVRARGR